MHNFNRIRQVAPSPRIHPAVRSERNGLTDGFVVCVVNSRGSKEAQVHAYSQGGSNVPTGRPHLHHLANAIEPSVCGCDVVLCQIALTTCNLLPILYSFLLYFGLLLRLGLGLRIRIRITVNV